MESDRSVVLVYLITCSLIITIILPYQSSSIAFRNLNTSGPQNWHVSAQSFAILISYHQFCWVVLNAQFGNSNLFRMKNSVKIGLISFRPFLQCCCCCPWRPGFVSPSNNKIPTEKNNNQLKPFEAFYPLPCCCCCWLLFVCVCCAQFIKRNTNTIKNIFQFR